MTIQKKICAAALVLLFSLSLLLGLPGSARAEAPGDAVNRFNVVLVVDKSGSLRNQRGHGTDPDGLRFDALRLFLGLLTESGNNVGAVVFDERIRYEAALEPLDGMEQKKALIRELEYYTPGYDTDIGSAVLRATELLTGMREENGLPCMILLFSDGMTDFTTDDISGRKLRSWAIADQALETAKAQGIVINGILLNVDGIAEGGRIEFQLYTHGTHGAFEEVSRPEDLAAAFRRFYAIINNARYTGSERVSFSEQGEAEYRFLVPSFGVEEVNVVVEGEHLRAGDSDDRRREGGGERVEMNKETAAQICKSVLLGVAGYYAGCKMVTRLFNFIPGAGTLLGMGISALTNILFTYRFALTACTVFSANRPGTKAGQWAVEIISAFRGNGTLRDVKEIAVLWANG